MIVRSKYSASLYLSIMCWSMMSVDAWISEEDPFSSCDRTRLPQKWCFDYHHKMHCSLEFVLELCLYSFAMLMDWQKEIVIPQLSFVRNLDGDVDGNSKVSSNGSDVSSVGSDVGYTLLVAGLSLQLRISCDTVNWGLLDRVFTASLHSLAVSHIAF